MKNLKCLSKIYNSSEIIAFDDTSRIVLMSDCHRGDGTWADDFSKNESIYYAALEHYFNEGYTYIEIGDGDELWENKRISIIVNVHKNVFQLLNLFQKNKRFYMIYGNHDLEKKNFKQKNNIFKYYDPSMKECVSLFEHTGLHEGLVLKHSESGKKIFLIHGHQVDFLNSTMWKLARFLVRHLWKPLEMLGINDPTSAAKNYIKKDLVEKKLIEWVNKKDCMLIAGHTHRPVFPDIGGPQYFNDGSCVHPASITAIEIVKGEIFLVKWCVSAKPDGTLYVNKENLAGPAKLNGYFEQNNPNTVIAGENEC